MPTITIQRNDSSGVVLYGGKYGSETLTLAAAGTVEAGTVLSRDAATGNMIPFVAGEVPSMVLDYELVADAAGDFAINPVIEGEVNINKLVGLSAADPERSIERDQLRGFNIVAQDVQELSQYDNGDPTP